jgi:siroheme synthase (precorrin-2 oxidase/ferrochelatase)
MVTVSTGGASPALSSWLRRELEELIGPEFAEIAAVLAAKRAQVHAEGASTEDIDWKPIIEEVIATHGVHSLSRREMEVAR